MDARIIFAKIGAVNLLENDMLWPLEAIQLICVLKVHLVSLASNFLILDKAQQQHFKLANVDSMMCSVLTC